jgi:hypothetical protein
MSLTFKKYSCGTGNEVGYGVETIAGSSLAHASGCHQGTIDELAMPLDTACPSCSMKITVPDEHLGMQLACPQCHNFIPTEPLTVLSDYDIVEEAPLASFAPASKTLTAEQKEFKKQRLARKKKKEKEEAAQKKLRMMIVGGVTVGGLCMMAVVIWIFSMIITQPSADDFADQEWKPLIVPDRVKVLFPGESKHNRQQVGPITLHAYSWSPDRNSMFMISYSEGNMPEDRRRLSEERLLNDSCDGAVANMEGAKELSRKSIKLGDIPGKEMVVYIPQGKGKGIMRAYYHKDQGRIYLLMAGGKGYQPDNPNVKKFFDSFEILEKGKSKEK